MSIYPSNSHNLAEDKGRRGRDNHSSSLVADNVIDPTAHITESQTSMDPASLGEAAGPATVLDIPRESRDLQASRSEIITKDIKIAGFSKKVVDRVTRGKLRATSVNIYDSRWRIFADWYSKHRINPWKSSIYQITEFRLHFFEIPFCL